MAVAVLVLVMVVVPVAATVMLAAGLTVSNWSPEGWIRKLPAMLKAVVPKA